MIKHDQPWCLFMFESLLGWGIMMVPHPNAWNVAGIKPATKNKWHQPLIERITDHETPMKRLLTRKVKAQSFDFRVQNDSECHFQLAMIIDRLDIRIIIFHFCLRAGRCGSALVYCLFVQNWNHMQKLKIQMKLCSCPLESMYCLKKCPGVHSTLSKCYYSVLSTNYNFRRIC